MKKSIRSRLLFVGAVFIIPGLCGASDVVKVNFDAAVRKYCHVLNFPQGWRMPAFVLDKNGNRDYPDNLFRLHHDYEVRVSGPLNNRFLVRGVELRHYYTANIYEVELSDPKAQARAAGEADWNDGTVVPLQYTGPADAAVKYIQSLGFQFQASGDHGEVDRVFPGRAVFVFQSWSGTLASGGSDVPGDFLSGPIFGRNHGKLFFDVFSADTGKKLITITASFNRIRPQEVLLKTGWITERYFFVPLDERRERCLICDFGRVR